MTVRGVIALLKAAFHTWQNAKAPRLAAALSYYTAFALAPVLIIVIAFAGLVYGQQAAQGQVFGELRYLVGPQSASTVQSLIAASSKPASSVLATIIGVVALLLGASGVFGELQDSLNTIWGAPPATRGGLWKLIRTRFLSFTMVLGVAFLLLVSLAVSASIAAIAVQIEKFLPNFTFVAAFMNFVVGWAIISLLFALLFKFLPDIRIEWRDVWLGAGITGLLFMLGQLLIGFYLARGTITSTYGASASLLILLLWVYYSAQIFLFGATITRVFSTRRGSHAGEKLPPPSKAAAA